MEEIEYWNTKKLAKEEKKEKVMHEVPHIGYTKPKHKLSDVMIGAAKTIGVATYSTLLKDVEIYKDRQKLDNPRKKKPKSAAESMIENANRWYE